MTVPGTVMFRTQSWLGMRFMLRSLLQTPMNEAAMCIVCG